MKSQSWRFLFLSVEFFHTHTSNFTQKCAVTTVVYAVMSDVVQHGSVQRLNNESQIDSIDPPPQISC